MQKGPILGGALLLVILTGVIVAKRMAPRLPGYVRNRVVSTLRQDYASDVEFSDLQVSIYPKIVIRGEGLVLRFHGRTDVPPLITIKRVSTEIGFWEFFRRTHHVRRITLEGLRVTMPRWNLARQIPLIQRHARKTLGHLELSSMRLSRIARN